MFLMVRFVCSDQTVKITKTIFSVLFVFFFSLIVHSKRFCSAIAIEGSQGASVKELPLGLDTAIEDEYETQSKLKTSLVFVTLSRLGLSSLTMVWFFLLFFFIC